MRLFLAIVWSSIPFISYVHSAHPTDTLRDGDEMQSGYVGGLHGMDPNVVSGPTFGNLWATKIPGEQFYSKLLVYTPPPSTDTLQQTILAFSTSNTVYQLNATTGKILIQRQVTIPFTESDLACADLSPTVGVTGTPVIDPNTGIVYFWSKTYNSVRTGLSDGTTENGQYYFYAIDAVTLATQPGYPKNPQNVTADNNPKATFNGGIQLQRPSLLLKNGVVYGAFGGNCDTGLYYGWVIGYKVSDGSLAAAWTSESGPQFGKGAGIWGGGGGVSTDSSNNIYVVTGNGNGHELQSYMVRASTSPPGTLSESAIKLSVGSDGKLTANQFFTPYDYQNLDAGDKDFGSTQFALLEPKTFKTSSVSGMGFSCGKGAEAYFLDTNNLGGYRTGPGGTNGILQEFSVSAAVFTAIGSFPLDGGYVYITPVGSPTSAYAFTSDGASASFSLAGTTPDSAAGRPGTGIPTTTSLNGQSGTGLLWMTDVDNGALRVYSAVPINGVLKNLFIAGGAMGKYQRPVFGDKKVFTANSGSINAYGAPVNLPVSCSPLDFGPQTVGHNATLMMQCNTSLPVVINAINSTNQVFFADPASVASIVGKSLAAKSTFTLPITFQPVYKTTDPNTKVSYGIVLPGAVAAAIQLFTTNGASTTKYSTIAPVVVKGVAQSAKPFLSVTPNNINLGGIVLGINSTAQQTLSASSVISNAGQSILHINGLAYSIVDSDTNEDDDGDDIDDLVLTNYTSSPFADIWSISDLLNVGDSLQPGETRSVKFSLSPTKVGRYQIQFYLYTDGGNTQIGLSGAAETAPVALLSVQQWNSSNAFVPVSQMDFGTLKSDGQNTLKLQMALQNTGASALTVTKSKPPAAGIISVLGNPLSEGTLIEPNATSYASIVFSPPLAPINTPPQRFVAQWTLNTDDLTFGVHEIQLFGIAAVSQVGPLLTNSSAQYQYLGCFDNTNNLIARTIQTVNNTGMQNGMCQSTCYSRGFIYAATNYASQCFCANSIVSNFTSLRVDDTFCNLRCVGDGSQNCGGSNNRVSLYADVTRTLVGTNTQLTADSLAAPGRGGPPAQIMAANKQFNYAGCFNDVTTKMQGFTTPETTKAETLEGCVNFCAKQLNGAGYTFIGVEYGSSCRCSNVLPVDNVLVPDTDCTSLCTGNSTEPCGGPSRLTLYKAAQPGSGSSSAPSNIQASTTNSQSTSTISTTSSSASSAASSLSFTTSTSISATASTTAPTNSSSTSTTSSPSSSSTSSSAVYTSITSSTTTTTSASMPTNFNSTNPVYPANPSIVNNFAMLGCYTDGSPRGLKKQLVVPTTGLTIEICINMCTMNNYKYVGLENANECWCDNTFDSTGTAGRISSLCTKPCKGNTTEICGGYGAMNIYAAARQSSSTASTSSITTTTTSSTTLAAQTTSTSSSTSSTTSITTSSTTSVSSTTTSVPTTLTTSTTMFTGTTSSTPATITSSSTTASPSQTPWVAQGCYTDSSNSRNLGALKFTDAGMTISRCTDYCASHGQPYAGLEAGNQCYCGSSLTPSVSTQCASPCSGDATATCGGTSSLNVYYNSLVGNPPFINIGNFNFTNAGCWQDGSTRLLSGLNSKGNSTMTPQSCVAYCVWKGFNIAGTEYGQECYCGNAFTSNATHLSIDTCNRPCVGLSSTTCGGANFAMNVYNATTLY